MLLLAEAEDVEEFKATAEGATTAEEVRLELMLLLEALEVADLPNETVGPTAFERELDRLDLRLLEDITGETLVAEEEEEVSPLSSGKSFGLAEDATATEATGGFSGEMAEAEGLSLVLLEPSATVVLSPSLCSMSASKSMIRSPMLMSNSL